MMNSTTRSGVFFLFACIAVAAVVFAGGRMAGNDYVFFAGYTVLQFVVLATAWNILGGLTGYVNFGAAAFFACGAYSTVFLHKYYPLPIPLLVAIGAVVSGLIGLGTGYLTLRLRGVYFAIATLAMAVVLRTLVTNWNYVGGARGAYVVRPATLSWPDLPDFAILKPLQPWVDVLQQFTEDLSLPYIQYLFLVMLAIAVIAVVIARTIERSKLGYGFATIRDDEVAAEASGVPTLKLKLIATTLSGALMGMAGAPFPYYIGYLQPTSAFALDYAVNSIAMPMIGGTTSWIGPVVGALLLGSLEQFITVTVTSEANLLIVGLLLVSFVIIAPKGMTGLWQRLFSKRKRPSKRQT
jgi:branched-chain amino acid transport system permease protein